MSFFGNPSMDDRNSKEAVREQLIKEEPNYAIIYINQHCRRESQLLPGVQH